MVKYITLNLPSSSFLSIQFSSIKYIHIVGKHLPSGWFVFNWPLLFNKYFLSTYHVPGWICGDVRMSKTQSLSSRNCVEKWRHVRGHRAHNTRLEHKLHEVNCKIWQDIVLGMEKVSGVGYSRKASWKRRSTRWMLISRLTQINREKRKSIGWLISRSDSAWTGQFSSPGQFNRNFWTRSGGEGEDELKERKKTLIYIEHIP